MARSRIEDAARRAGLDFEQAPALAPQSAGGRDAGSTIVVVDLDSGGREALAALAAARETGNEPLRAIGYFSHVDVALGEAARGAGVEAHPRGRFWRTLPDILGSHE
jgi:hypothetical protein